jgi:hypothetical protein
MGDAPRDMLVERQARQHRADGKAGQQGELGSVDGCVEGKVAPAQLHRGARGLGGTAWADEAGPHG